MVCPSWNLNCCLCYLIHIKVCFLCCDFIVLECKLFSRPLAHCCSITQAMWASLNFEKEACGSLIIHLWQGKTLANFIWNTAYFVARIVILESQIIDKEYLSIPEWDKILQSKVKNETIWKNTKVLCSAFIKICSGFKRVSKYSLYYGLNQG